MSGTPWEGGGARPEVRPWVEVVAGVGLVLGLHVAVGVVLSALSLASASAGGGVGEAVMVVAMGWFFAIGLSQLSYVVPAFAVAFLWRRNVAAGVLLGALLTFLLNGACFGVMCAGARY